MTDGRGRTAELSLSVLRHPSSVICLRKAPLNGRRLVPKTRVTARSEVRFLSLPPIQRTDDGGRMADDARVICLPSSVLRHPNPSIAQLEQSTRLRTGRSQVRVLLDGPISGR